MTTRRKVLALGAAATLAAPSIARAQTQKWRMVTSWPKRLPGPGMSAERVAERIATLSGGRLTIEVYAAGEIVPAFEVLDAVGGGVAEIGHTASFYWQGKMPAAAFFTTVPFGLTPGEHVAWVEAGGGQALWDELYAPFGVKPFMGGNTGVCMGGWFRREIEKPRRLRGVKIRSLGLGGEVYRRLGATPQTTPPAEILTSLQSGVLDARRIRRPRHRHRARALSRGAVLLLSGLQQAERHRRVHRLAQGVERARRRAEGDRRARLRGGSEFRARRNGAAQCRGARGADRAAQRASSRLPGGSGRGRAQGRSRRARRTGGARRDRRARCTKSYAEFRDRTAPWSRVSIEAVLEARG